MDIKKLKELLLLQIKINKGNNEIITNLNEITKLLNKEVAFLKSKIEKIDKIIIGMTINN